MDDWKKQFEKATDAEEISSESNKLKTISCILFITICIAVGELIIIDKATDIASTVNGDKQLSNTSSLTTNYAPTTWEPITAPDSLKKASKPPKWSWKNTKNTKIQPASSCAYSLLLEPLSLF